MAFEFSKLAGRTVRGVAGAAKEAAAGVSTEYLGAGITGKLGGAMGGIAESFSRSSKDIGGNIEKAQRESTHRTVQALGEVNESVEDIGDIVAASGKQTKRQLKRVSGDLGDLQAVGLMGTLGGGVSRLLGPLAKMFGPFGRLLKPLTRIGALFTPLTSLAAGIGPLMKLAVPMLGKAGLVGAAGAVGYGIGKLLNMGIDKLFGEEGGLGKWVYDALHGEGMEKIMELVGWIKDLGMKIVKWSPPYLIYKRMVSLIEWFKELDFGGIIETIKTVTGTLKWFWPPYLMYKGIETLIDWFKGLDWSSVIETVKSFTDKLKTHFPPYRIYEGIVALIDWFKELDWSGPIETVKTVVDKLKGFWPPYIMYKGITSLIDWFKELDWVSIIGEVKEGVTTLFTVSPITLIKRGIDSLREWFSTLSFEETVESVKDAVKFLFSVSPMGLMVRGLRTLGEWFNGLSIEGAIESVKEGVDSLFKALPFGRIGEGASTLYQWFSGLSLGDLVQQIKDSVQSMWDRLPFSKVGEAADSLIEWFKGFSIADVVETIKEKFSSLLQGIKDSIGEIDIAQIVVDSIRSVFTWMSELFSAKNLIAALKSGIGLAAGKLGWVGKKLLSVAGLGGGEAVAAPVVEPVVSTAPVVPAMKTPIPTVADRPRVTPGTPSKAEAIEFEADGEKTVGLLGEIKDVLGGTKELLGRLFSKGESTLREHQEDPMMSILGTGAF